MGNFELEFLWAELCVGSEYAGKVEFLVFNADRQPKLSLISGLRSQVSGLSIQTRIHTIKVEKRTDEKTFGQHMGTRLKIW
jgi:hypothetical protein